MSRMDVFGSMLSKQPDFKYQHDMVREYQMSHMDWGEVRLTLRPDVLVSSWNGEKHTCVDLVLVSPLDLVMGCL